MLFSYPGLKLTINLLGKSRYGQGSEWLCGKELVSFAGGPRVRNSLDPLSFSWSVHE